MAPSAVVLSPATTSAMTPAAASAPKAPAVAASGTFTSVPSLPSPGSGRNCSSDNSDKSIAFSKGSSNGRSSSGASDALTRTGEGVASQVTSVLKDIFGKARPPPLPPPPEAEGASLNGSHKARPGSSRREQARELALAAELEALGKDFNVDDDYESLRAFAHALGTGPVPSTTAAEVKVEATPARTPSATGLRAEDTEDESLFGANPLPPPSLDGLLPSCSDDDAAARRADEGDSEDTGAVWRRSKFRSGQLFVEDGGKGLFDFD